MSETIDPGEGWRLLEEGEAIAATDQYHRMTHGWKQVVSVAGARYDREEHYPIRRRIDSEQPLMESTDAAEVGLLQSEITDLRQKLADTTERLEERSDAVRRQTDYSISLQKAIEAHKRGNRADSQQCPHHADMLNADLDLTEQRECEIVNQMRREGRIEIMDESRIWFTLLHYATWQCRPLQPKPVTITIEVPAADVGAAKAMASEKGWKVT